MRSPIQPRLAVLLAVACAALATTVPGASAAAKHCKRVANPYAGTRYAGEPLSHIRARGVSCRKARRVARGAHRKALGQTPPPSGIRHLRWHGYKVRGNLRGAHDRYVARKPGKRVRWRF